MQILQWFQKLVTQISHIEQQKAAWFESDFCVSCASYIATLISIGIFCLWNFTKISHI